MSVPDRIEKKILLRAPLERVWRAISDSSEFGAWFGVAFDGPFVAGTRMLGRIRPTEADPDVAKLQAPHAGKPFEVTIEEISAPRRFSFRWHPFAIDPAVDYSAEPTTLVLIELSEADGGTLLRITESGFDGVPLARRAQAFTANDGGWEHQTKLVKRWVDGPR